MVNVMCSYPMQVHPCRNCLDKVFGHTKYIAPSAEDESDDTLDVGDVDHAPSEMSTTKLVVITTVVVTLGYGVAYFVNDLQMGELLSAAIA